MAMESFLRKFEKTEKDKAVEKEKSTKTPAQLGREEQEQKERAARPTIPQMMQDPALSQQFGAFLGAHKDPTTREMGARMLSGQLEEADVGSLEKKRDELFEQKAQSERLGEAIKGGRFKEMLERSPQLQSLCQAYGEENIQEILESGARELMFRDQKGFKELYGVLEAIEKFERDFEEPLQNKMSAFCKQFRLTEDTVLKAMTSDVTKERQEQLKAAIQNSMTGWGAKLPKWLPASMKLPQWLPAKWSGQEVALSGRIVGWGEKAKDLGRSPAEQRSEYGKQAVQFGLHKENAWKSAIEMREKVFEEQGGFIASFVSKNAEVRQALGRVINGEMPYFKEVTENTATYSEAREMLLTEESAKKYVDQYKSADANKKINFTNLPPAELDKHMGKIYDEARNRLQGEASTKTGWFMSILSFLLNMTKERDNFIKNPAMRKMVAGA